MTACGAGHKCWHGSLPATIGSIAENKCSPRVPLTVDPKRPLTFGGEKVSFGWDAVVRQRTPGDACSPGDVCSLKCGCVGEAAAAAAIWLSVP
jgi:hypothetical protein